MKMRLPSIRSVLVSLGTLGLAVWSLPFPTCYQVSNHDPSRIHHRTQSIPTMATVAPTNTTQDKPQAPKKNWSPKQGAPKAAVPSQPKPAPKPVPKPNQGPSQGGHRYVPPHSAPPAPPSTPSAPPASPSRPNVPPAPPSTPNPNATPLPSTAGKPGYSQYGAKLSKLRIRVIDGRTLKVIPGAEVVLIETEQRFTTGANGMTPWIDAPVIRNPKFRPMVAELHGQLGVIAYKNGYRDSVHLGIRMHDGVQNETTVWMYKIGPGDTRVEPVLYEVPYHRIWLIELADKFRSKTQPGEGPERP